MPFPCLFLAPVVHLSVSRVQSLPISRISLHVLTSVSDMPACDATFSCHCSCCCNVDENGIPCNPSGKLIRMHHKVPHLQCIDSRVGNSPKEWEIAVRSLVENETEWVTPSNAVDSLGACLFALTLTDDRPDLNSQANKLWTSQEDFQHDANTWVPSNVCSCPLVQQHCYQFHPSHT